MTAFLKKHKWTILYWVILLFIVLYFAPRQNKYYLDNDIDYFKTQYLRPILLWTGGVIPVGLFLFWLIRTKSIKQSAIGFAYVVVALAFFLFIFQDIFLGASLFINRQLKRDSVQKIYQANYMAGTDQSKSNFIPYDLTTKQISIERKLINKLYTVGLKQNDTISLNLYKGLLGIAFNSQPFDDK
jgi:hypothetical protein